jgi:exodeoxyribonuclease VII small subunit
MDGRLLAWMLMSESPSDALTFEQALARLEQIVRDLEDGSIGLEDALARYEAGIGLLKRCYGQLEHAEQRILLLTGVDEEGRPAAQPFEHSATVEAEKPEVKRRRKKPDEPEKLF